MVRYLPPDGPTGISLEIQHHKLSRLTPGLHTAVGTRQGGIERIEFNRRGRLTGHYIVKYFDFTTGYWVSTKLIYTIDPLGNPVLLKQFPPRYSRLEH